MSVPTEPPAVDPVAVRRAFRAAIRAAGYAGQTVTYIAAYPDTLRVHTLGPDGVTKHVHDLPGNDGQSWSERR